MVSLGDNGGPPLDEGPSPLLGGRTDFVGLQNLKYLAALDDDVWGPVRLSLHDGEPLRRYIADWIGRPAERPRIGAGIARLAHFIEVSVWHGAGWPPAPRPLIRVALCGIGIFPDGDPELAGDDRLDTWLQLLMFWAQHRPGDYSLIATAAAA